ncbi:MAG TPA: TonB-dependent receptor, partial [Chthoniobacterales bacterium]|nr:TonB-dependent receptor [Chthoniobacterales bacterium]
MSAHRLPCAALFLVCLTSGGHAQEAVAERVVVSAARLPDLTASSPFATRALAAEELERAPQLRLDDILRAQVPGFSLFRRSSSRVAHPTTQGVTLRSFGPSGAGRTLVLLDGIPLNDPFAGYVQWNQLPAAAIESIVVQSGGGSGLFGNAALAGTIFVTSRLSEARSLASGALGGTHDTYALDLVATLAAKPVSASVFAERFATGGYPILQRDQRGLVDRDADSESTLLHLGSAVALSRSASLELRMRLFAEERSNGTVYTRNSTRGEDLSATLAQRFPALSSELRLSGYYQHRRFRSTFSSVNAARDEEMPALDQFHVPADALGGSAVWAMSVREGHLLTFGADARWVDGETNERFRFIEDDFTRTRAAGGEQFFVGLFAEDRWDVSDAASVLGSVRLDYWRNFNGRRNEFDRATRAATLRSVFPDRYGWSPNARLGSTLRLTDL